MLLQQNWKKHKIMLKYIQSIIDDLRAGYWNMLGKWTGPGNGGNELGGGYGKLNSSLSLEIIL